MSFENYNDLFKWNKNLMEDDWNDGQHLVIKAKGKGDHHDFASTTKIGHEDASGKSKIATEQKLKGDIGKYGEYEIKMKNFGNLSYETELVSDHPGADFANTERHWRRPEWC